MKGCGPSGEVILNVARGTARGRLTRAFRHWTSNGCEVRFFRDILNCIIVDVEVDRQRG